VRGYLAEAQPYQRFLYRIAGLFVASVILNAVVFMADDRPWDAPASWRQPLLFSLAFLLVLPPLAWVMNFLPKRKGLGWTISGTLGLAAVGEVSLIAMQAWREQPPFFHDELPFDQAVFAAMAGFVGFVVLAIVVETVWVFTSLRAPPSFRWAIRVGLVLTIAGLVMGGLMITEGLRQQELGPVPSPVVFGEAGLVVFPHLLSFHSLLILSALAWLLSFTALPERRRTSVVQAAAAIYVVLVAVSLAQALAGRAAFDLTGSFALVFWISVALLMVAFIATLGFVWQRRLRGA
jgi:MFS family permease